MAELKEPASGSRGHKKENDDCPFCPPKARKPFKTYPGAENHSSALGAIMKRPKSLTTRDHGGPGARKQEGAKEDGWAVQQAPPTPRPKAIGKKYSFQAHHLISGNQAMDGNPIEKWIVKSDKLKADTGYSINNTYNGWWAPSVPNAYRGKWAAEKGFLSDAERQDAAEEVMRDAVAQIHIGPHNISDPTDPLGKKHDSYDKYLKKKLTALASRIDKWAGKCLCEAKKDELPRDGTHRIHDAIDAISDHMQGKIDCGVQSWDIFLSEYARDYHNKPGNCRHGLRKRK